MRRGFLVFLIVVALGFGAAAISRNYLQSPPSAWLCSKFGLSPRQAERMESLRRDYGSRCGPLCGKMCEANAHLENLALGSGSVTPGIRAAIAETDRIRTETRIAMLDHFYAVAAELPPERRKEYLLKVLPLVIDSCGSH
jgi:hypothetical protein